MKRISIATPNKKEVLISPLSREQSMLQEMFSGESFWGLPEDNLPKINGTLFKGAGILKSGDGGETGMMFGIRR